MLCCLLTAFQTPDSKFPFRSFSILWSESHPQLRLRHDSIDCILLPTTTLAIVSEMPTLNGVDSLADPSRFDELQVALRNRRVIWCGGFALLEHIGKFKHWTSDDDFASQWVGGGGGGGGGSDDCSWAHTCLLLCSGDAGFEARILEDGGGGVAEGLLLDRPFAVGFDGDFVGCHFGLGWERVEELCISLSEGLL